MLLTTIATCWSLGGFLGFDDDDDDKPQEELPPIPPFTSTMPLEYQNIRFMKSFGATIFEIEGTLDQCTLACSTDVKCTGWLKTGNFWDERATDAFSELFIQHKSADFPPLIS